VSGARRGEPGAAAAGMTRGDGHRGWNGRRPLLIVAHPGHELCVHGWLETTRPCVFVLTDGSGRSGVSRLDYTTRILEHVRAERGALYGRFADREVYEAILHGDNEVFQGLADELAAALADGSFTDVVGDAAEGYNPTHDLCRLPSNAAVEMVRRTRGSAIGNFDFSLVGELGRPPDASWDGAMWLDLEEAALERKVAAARAYGPLQAEVEAALAMGRVKAFRRECLRSVGEPAGRYPLAELPPYYECYGAQQVAAGHYERVLRYRKHMVPIAAALRAHVAASGGR